MEDKVHSFHLYKIRTKRFFGMPKGTVDSIRLSNVNRNAIAYLVSEGYRSGSVYERQTILERRAKTIAFRSQISAKKRRKRSQTLRPLYFELSLREGKTPSHLKPFLVFFFRFFLANHSFRSNEFSFSMTYIHTRLSLHSI